jgi:hypothetical protein
MPVSPVNPVCKEIVDALGLKNVRSLEIKMGSERLVSVDVTYFPEIDGVKQFPAILAKYKLVPREEGD